MRIGFAPPALVANFKPEVRFGEQVQYIVDGKSCNLPELRKLVYENENDPLALKLITEAASPHTQQVILAIIEAKNKAETQPKKR